MEVARQSKPYEDIYECYRAKPEAVKGWDSVRSSSKAHLSNL